MSRYEDNCFELYSVLTSMNDETKKNQALQLFLSDGYQIKESDIIDYYSYEGMDYIFRRILHNYEGTLSKETIMDIINMGNGVPLPELLVHADDDFYLSTEEIIELLYMFDQKDTLSFKYLFDIFTPASLDGDTLREIMDIIPETAYKYARKYLQLLPPDETLEIWQDYYQDFDESSLYKDYYARAAEPTYEEVMKGIKEGLSGDALTDLDYIKLQMEYYKNHKYAKEIIRELGRMEYALLPDEAKKEINSVINEKQEEFEKVIELAGYLIFQKRYEEALKLLNEMIEETETSQSYEGDAVNEYYSFNEMMEEVLYSINYESRKTVRICPYDYATLYYMYGNILVELKRFKEAKFALEKARRWNPVSINIGFEYAETLKGLGDIEEFYEVTKGLYPFIFKREDLARFYRNIGYYFVEKKEYKSAVCCYIYSGKIFPSEVVPSELYYIFKKSGVDYDPTQEELNEIFEKNDIPMYICDEVINAAYSLAKKAEEEKDEMPEAYFKSILMDIAPDDD